MLQVLDFFKKLLDVADWPRRWECGIWSDFHGWLYILSDVTIWLAYFAIPVILVYFIQKRKDIPFLPMFWLFSAFILLCGLTHILDAIIFWWPAYRLSALARFATAVVSVATVLALIRDVPKALKLKSAASLEQEAARRESAEGALQKQNETLQRMLEKLGERDAHISELEAEVKRLRSAGS